MILGINTAGKKEVLTIQVGDNESSKSVSYTHLDVYKRQHHTVT